MVPVRLRRVSGMTVPGEVDAEGQIQEEVLFHFQKILCLDRQDYDERLDFYEIRFNSAIVALRSTARKSVWKKDSRRTHVELDGDSSDSDQDFEESLERVRSPNLQKKDDVLFRLIFLEAISSLPPEEREVIELLLAGYPIDSKKPGVRTVAMILKCDEKTVRNRRNRARAALKALKLEEAV
jgi:DNA-directed RNA polymerase specialized sigma24 family protein